MNSRTPPKFDVSWYNEIDLNRGLPFSFAYTVSATAFASAKDSFETRIKTFCPVISVSFSSAELSAFSITGLGSILNKSASTFTVPCFAKSINTNAAAISR